MSKALRPWLFFAFSVVLAAAVIVFVYVFTERGYATAGRLTELLPQPDAVLFYADVDALRHSGFLRFLEAAKGSQEADYQRFVLETGFNYQRDLDAVAVSSLPNQLYAVARGRFDWSKLTRYAAAHGGKCQNRFCRLPASQPGKWLSFFPVRSEIIGLAVSSDPQAAYSLLPREGAPRTKAPAFPLWVKIPHRVLDDPNSLPPAGQVMARALSSASTVTFGVTQASSAAPDSAVDVRLIAGCDSQTVANNLRDHLQQLTRLLGRLSSRNASNASPDLGRLLSSGSFVVDGQELLGEWLVPHSVIDSLFE